jgi:hypothetical protein
LGSQGIATPLAVNLGDCSDGPVAQMDRATVS